jgi:hypothetical protein
MQAQTNKNRHLFNPTTCSMDTQRPKRQTKKPSRYSQSPSLVPLESQLSEVLEVRRPLKRPLQAIPAEPIPEDLAESLLPFKQREIPPYTPPLGYIEYKAGSGVSEATDELSTFLLLFSEDCIKRIIAATNSYAERDQNELSYDFARKWIPMSRVDLLHFIGCLFYIGMHKETLRDDY